MEEQEIKEFVLKNGVPSRPLPVVRFTGTRIGQAVEKGVFNGETREFRWTLYRTVGGNYVLQRVEGEYHQVCDFKKPHQILAHLKKYNRADRHGDGPKDWSPRMDFGIAEELVELLMEAGPEFKALFYHDVE